MPNLKQRIVIDVNQTTWRELTTPEQRATFSGIMQSMDERYRGLNPEQLDSWIARKSEANRPAVLLGLFDKSDSIIQVIAFTVRPETDGRAEQRSIAMMGAVIQEANSASVDTAVVTGWLAQIVRAVHQQFGCPAVVEAMRPKTMTFKPMQDMHDLMKNGLIIALSDNSEEVWEATTTESNDRGHSIFLRMTLEPASTATAAN